MSGGIFSYALLAALATALMVAAFTDLRRREIDNRLNLAIALAAPLWWLAMGFGWAEVGFQLALAAGTFIIVCIFFALRQMGGGDVKLLTALALWFTPASFLQVIVLMAVIGGGGSIAMAALNMRRVPGEIPRDVLAATAALIWVCATCAMLVALATGNPLIGAGTAAAVRTVLPQPWTMALAALALIVIVIAGLGHIRRRQKSSLRVPYGIAIAAASLWVLGEQTLWATRLAAQTG